MAFLDFKTSVIDVVNATYATLPNYYYAMYLNNLSSNISLLSMI